MRPLLSHVHHHRGCLKSLKKMIPNGSVINCFFFFLGELELGLADTGRFVSAHTDNAVVYEFWSNLQRNPSLIKEIVVSEQFQRLGNSEMFALLQDRWRMHRDPYVRSALFYLLSRHSVSGQPSFGEYSPAPTSPRQLQLLENFNLPTFHITRFENKSVVDYAMAQSQGDYSLFSLGRFRLNTLQQRFHQRPEETHVDHPRFHREITQHADSRPFIVLYKKHSRVLSLYKNFNVRMVDSFGHQTLNIDNCEDIIVSNF